MSEDVVKLAVFLGGAEESEALEKLCALAAEELESQLRPGITAEDCGEAFVLAAAWLALAAQVEAGSDDVTAFTAGDVSLRRETGSARAGALRRRAGEIMRPYCRDQGFDFRSVRYG